jgi:hypothetical protein
MTELCPSRSVREEAGLFTRPAESTLNIETTGYPYTAGEECRHRILLQLVQQ